MASANWKAAERKTAETLGLWWAGSKKAFKRTPVSGGWPTKGTHGDIIANDELKLDDEVKQYASRFHAEWTVEVKRRKTRGGGSEWTFEQLLTCAKHPIFKWWKQVTEVAGNRGTNRMLIFMKGNGQRFIAFGEREMGFIRGCFTTHHGGQPQPFEISKLFGLRIVIRSGCLPDILEDLTIFNLAEFLKRVPASLLGGIGDAPKGLEEKAKERLRKASAENTASG